MKKNKCCFCGEPTENSYIATHAHTKAKIHFACITYCVSAAAIAHAAYRASDLEFFEGSGFDESDFDGPRAA